MTMNLAIRVDASVDIGIGHVMRCLTLADAVRKLGGACLFVCRPAEGDMIASIKSRGHKVELIGGCNDGSYGAHPEPPVNADWLGGNWQDDADQTRKAARDFQADCVVVDHYALDIEWESRLRFGNVKILVIDDLANRPHSSDILLDQNLSRLDSDYDSLVPTGCQRLVGPAFSLLRPEFAELRKTAVERRFRISERNRLLITMGGVDKNNATGTILGALSRVEVANDLQISVVLGSAAPWLNEVKAQIETLPFEARVLVDVSDMAELMLQSDFCLGASGSTTWERCCLALPTALVILAENQRETAEFFVQNRQALLLDDGIISTFEQQLDEIITAMRDEKEYQELARNCSEIVDGRGVERVISALSQRLNFDTARPLGLLRRVEDRDLEEMREWRNSPNVRSMMFTKHEISSEEHRTWWEQQKDRDDAMHLIYEFRGLKYGVLSFSQINLDRRTASWAFYASPDAPKGTGSRMEFLMLEKAFFQLGLNRLDCVVLEVNEKVRKLHERFGFSASDKKRPISISEQSGEPIYELSLHKADWEKLRVSYQTRLLEREASP